MKNIPPVGYEHHKLHGAMFSINRSITANYNYSYVARYEKYPQKALSKIRADVALALAKNLTQVCDVGCGTGAFLGELKERVPNLNTFGYDVSDYPLPDWINKVPDWSEKAWELVTFFDSLEHFTNIDFVENLNAKYVIVSVPWYHPCLGHSWFYNWKHRRPGEHLWHFTPDTLSAVFARGGFIPRIIGNPEDQVRKSDNFTSNILTVGFEKI